MATSDLKIRTKDYALSVIRLFAALPKRTETQILGRQLLRAGTSVVAQYREATRAKSNADFISKIKGSLQELEETVLARTAWRIRIFSGRRIGRGKKRNRRVEGDIRQHRNKHQSQIQTSETLNSLSPFILHPFALILSRNLSFILLP
jgi:four helix bundle protein